MSQWLLLVNAKEDEAQAIEVTAYKSPGGVSMGFFAEISDTEPAFRIGLYHEGKAYNNHTLKTSANNGGGFAYQLLWDENQKQKLLSNQAGDYQFHASAHFNLETAPLSVTGKSADLLFALAVITAALPREGGYPHYAATGRLDHPAGAVYKVNGIPAKLNAAIVELTGKPGEKFIFIPRDNEGDVPATMREEIKPLGIEICPLEWFDEALEKLKVPLQIHLGNPYCGLHSFTYQQRGVYFGRGREAEELAQKLMALEHSGTAPVLSILAPSGAGKTSFIQAGLRHALENVNPLPEHRWIFQNWIPSKATKAGDNKEAKVSASALLEHLRASFLTPDLAARQDAAQALQQAEDFTVLASRLTAAVPSDCRFVWIIDQAEELFTQYEKAALDGFIVFLQALHEAGIWLLIALRNDFFPQYQAELQDLCNLGHDWHKLDADALDAIIQKPANLARRPPIRFEQISEHQSLATLLRKDMQTASGQGGDALPLLQFALDELYRRSEARHKAEMAVNPDPSKERPRYLELTQADYDAMGGLTGAVGQKAEEAYQQQSSDAQKALPKLLWDLVIFREGHDFSAQAANLANYPESSAGRELIDAFADPKVRLLVFDEGKVRVAHEALFRHWETAKTQLALLRDDMAVRERVRHEYEIWNAKGKTDDLLLMPVIRLAEGEALLTQRGDLLDGELIGYIRASQQAEAERQRLEQARMEKELALAEEARQQAELAQARAEQVARQQSELAEQQTQLAQERQEKAEKLRRKARQLLAAALVSLAAAGVAGWYWWEAGVQKEEAVKKKAEVAETLVRSDFSQGVQLAEQGKPNEALAYLARAIRTGHNEKAANLAASLIALKINQPRAILKHDSKVNFAHFSPDGRWVVTGSEDGLSQVWDAETGAKISTPVRHDGDSVKSGQFSPDGSQVVTISSGTAIIWDAKTGRYNSIKFNHGQGPFNSVQFSSDGRRIVTASRYYSRAYFVSMPGRTKIWNTNKQDFPLKNIDLPIIEIEHENDAISSQYSPDGNRVVTTFGNTTQILDAKSGNILSELHNPDRVISAQFSHDGHLIMTVSENAVIVWDAKTYKPINDKIHHRGLRVEGPQGLLALRGAVILSAKFSPDDRWIATASWDKTVRIWNAKYNFTYFKTFVHKNAVRLVEFSPDGRWLITASENKAQIWNVQTGQPLFLPLQHQNVVQSIEFSPDGRRVVTASSDGTAKVWDIGIIQLVAAQIQHKTVEQSSELIAVDRQSIMSSEFEEDIERDDKTGEKVTLYDGYPPPLNIEDGIAQFSSDGRRVITALDNAAQIWDAETGKPITSPMLHQANVVSALFSPDGHYALTASEDMTARIWESATGKQLPFFIQNDKPILSAKFSPDGQRVLTISEKTARLWNAKTRQLLPIPPIDSHINMNYIEHTIHGKRLANATQFSQNGNLIMNINPQSPSHVAIWNAETGSRIRGICHHCEAPPKKMNNYMQSKIYAKIQFSTFSPDSHLVATASQDHSAQVWYVNGKPFSPSMRHNSIVQSVQFSPDSGRVVTASWDGTARVWNAKTGEPLAVPMQHRDIVQSAEFSPDGHQVVTGSWDGTARVWDAETGLPLSEPMQHKSVIQLAKFSIDGHSVLTVSKDKMVRIWEILHIPQPGTDFSNFIDQIVGYRLSDNGGLEIIPIKSKAEINTWLIQADNINSYIRRFIEWSVSNSSNRTVTPNGKQTVKERVQQLIDHDSVQSLNEALDHWPGHPLALAKLAAVTLRDGEPDERESDTARARLWANLALKYAPEDPAVRAVAEPVLRTAAPAAGENKP